MVAISAGIMQRILKKVELVKLSPFGEVVYNFLNISGFDRRQKLIDVRKQPREQENRIESTRDNLFDNRNE